MMQHEARRRGTDLTLLLVGSILSAALAACGGPRGPSGTTTVSAADLRSLDQRGAYVAAYELGRNLREQGVAADAALLARGIQDGFTDRVPLLSEPQMHQAMLEFGDELERRRRKSAALTAERNRGEGRDFLRANRQRPGVVELPSGLQYEVLRQGTGRRPSVDGRVSVHYEGRLLDGTVFNTTQGMGRPMILGVDEVIAGWREALLLMREGARWRVWLPPELAFGGRSPSPLVGADATVVFEIELLSVE